MTSVTPFPVKTQGFYANFNFTVLRPPRVAALFFCCYQETLKNFHPGKRIFQVTFYAAAAGAYYVYFRMYRYMLHVRILWAVRIYKKRLKKRMALPKKCAAKKKIGDAKKHQMKRQLRKNGAAIGCAVRHSVYCASIVVGGEKVRVSTANGCALFIRRADRTLCQCSSGCKAERSRRCFRRYCRANGRRLHWQDKMLAGMLAVE